MFVCRAVCAPRDLAADTVKINMASQGAQEGAERHAAEELQAWIQAGEAEEVQRRAQEEEQEARTAEESARLALKEAARRRAEESARVALERLRQEEAARRAEKARREREAAEAEEARRLEEEERLTQERKEKVAAFLKEHKFKSTSAGKKTMLSTTYAIHTAAVRGDEEMVKMLMQEGADPKQKNSSGKTAAQVAQKESNNGSHAAVLRVLGGA